jgi:D-cysteine desulfhydrase
LGGTKPEVYDGNLLLSSILGPKSILWRIEKEKTEKLKNKLENTGSKCFVIPYGGSNFTGAMSSLVLLRIKRALMNKTEKIIYFFPSSSGGMQAGLTLGKEIYQLDSELIQ